MKITFILTDTYNAWELTQTFNRCIPPQKRTVTITLTPAQEEAVRRLKVGSIGSRDIFEEIQECFVDCG